MSLISLPPELIVRISYYLEPKDLLSCCHTNRSWRRVWAQEPVWEAACHSELLELDGEFHVGPLFVCPTFKRYLIYSKARCHWLGKEYKRYEWKVCPESGGRSIKFYEWLSFIYQTSGIMEIWDFRKHPRLLKCFKLPHGTFLETVNKTYVLLKKINGFVNVYTYDYYALLNSENIENCETQEWKNIFPLQYQIPIPSPEPGNVINPTWNHKLEMDDQHKVLCVVSPGAVSLYDLKQGFQLASWPIYFGTDSDLSLKTSFNNVFAKVKSLILCWNMKHEALSFQIKLSGCCSCWFVSPDGCFIYAAVESFLICKIVRIDAKTGKVVRNINVGENCTIHAVDINFEKKFILCWCRMAEDECTEMRVYSFNGHVYHSIQYTIQTPLYPAGISYACFVQLTVMGSIAITCGYGWLGVWEISEEKQVQLVYKIGPNRSWDDMIRCLSVNYKRIVCAKDAIGLSLNIISVINDGKKRDPCIIPFLSCLCCM